MTVLFDHRRLWSFDGSARIDGSALIDVARQLRRSAASGANANLLRGKQIALLTHCDTGGGCDDDPDAGGAMLCRAGQALGATVTRLRHGSGGAGRSPGLPGMARVLGRMYDAVDCNELAADVALELERAAGVPVFNRLSSAQHPARVLAQQMALEDAGHLAPAPPEAMLARLAIDNHAYIVQAILLATLR